jgi:putative transposase
VSGRLVAHALRLFGPEPPRLALVWADAAPGGALVEERHEQFGWRVEIVKRPEERPKPPGFQVQPHRWIVGRSFGWFGGVRRLSRGYEDELESSEATIYAAMSHRMLRRLGRHTRTRSCPPG